MARFRVAFDGERQGEFDDLTEAMEWAQEVSLTGRMTWVVERRGHGLLHDKLRAAFPEERREQAELIWKGTASANWPMGGGTDASFG